MSLSNDLISQFAKTATKSPEKQTSNIMYGTAVTVGEEVFVRLDGSEMLTPVATTVTVQDGERVSVTIEKHKATITGSISEPAVSNDDLDDLYTMIADFQENAVVSSTPYYKSSASSSVAPDCDAEHTGWTTSIERVDGEYIWMITEVIYMNGTVKNTEPVCISGSSGVGISAVTEIYRRYTKARPTLPTSSSAVSSVSNTDSWTTAVPSVTTAYKYVWISTMVTLSDGRTTFTTPVLSQDLGYYANFNSKIESSLYSGTAYLGDDYIIYPNIGGGYLDILGNGNRVIIDPADVDPANDGEYLLFAQSNNKTVFGIDRAGNAEFAGELKAATGSFYGAVDMRSTDFVGYSWFDVIGARFKDECFCLYTGVENAVHSSEDNRYTIKRMLAIQPGEAANSQPIIYTDYSHIDLNAKVVLPNNVFLYGEDPNYTNTRLIGMSSSGNVSINPDCAGNTYIRAAADGYVCLGDPEHQILGVKLNGNIISFSGSGATKTSELTQTYTNASASGHGNGARLITFNGITSGDNCGATAKYVQNYCNNYTAAHYSELGHTHSGYAAGSHKHTTGSQINATSWSSSIATSDLIDFSNTTSNTYRAATPLYVQTYVSNKISSDIRLKKDIRFSEAQSLALINSIKMREFTWMDDFRGGQHWDVGVIADELELLDERFVFHKISEDDIEPKYKSVDTWYLTGHILKAIQELSSMIEALKQDVKQGGN